MKAAFHYRTDVHTEQQTNRPDASDVELDGAGAGASRRTPGRSRSRTRFASRRRSTSSRGVSYDTYDITKAEEFTAAARSASSIPKGGSDAFNWQAAMVWRHARSGEWHASVSDRARFPVIFELYSTRFGTATPNPDLGPERATNIEFGLDAGDPRQYAPRRDRVLQRREGPDSDRRVAGHDDTDAERREW